MDAMFRAWVMAFLRPASVHGGRPISLHVNQVLREAVDVLMAAIAEYEAAHPLMAQLPWSRLPPEVRYDVTTRGSPGWVRCQCVHMHRH